MHGVLLVVLTFVGSGCTGVLPWAYLAGGVAVCLGLIFWVSLRRRSQAAAVECVDGESDEFGPEDDEEPDTAETRPLAKPKRASAQHLGMGKGKGKHGWGQKKGRDK